MKLTKHNYHNYFNLSLKPIQRLIVDTILSHALNGKDYAYPSHPTIAKEINTCRHTVMRNLKKIKKNNDR